MINTQQRSMNCGPVSIYNLIDFLDHKASYQDVENFCLKKGIYDHKTGVTKKSFRQALNEFGITHTLKKQITLKDIDNAIDNGRLIFFRYAHKNGGHLVFISGRTDKTYTAWNMFLKNKTPIVHRKTMAKIIQYANRFYHRDHSTWMIII